MTNTQQKAPQHRIHNLQHDKNTTQKTKHENKKHK